MNSSFPSASFPSAPTFRRTKTRARGFSLLEVAIALVIFVFGALAIVRIFPGALRVITVGGARQNALNLNRGAMARVQLNPPAATYDVGPMGTGWQDGYLGDPTANPPIPAEPRAVLGSTRRGYSLPHTANQMDIDVSAIGSIRQVIGEPETVGADASGKLFVLTQFPIYDQSEITVSEKAALTGVTIDGSGTLDFSNARWSNSGDSFAQISGDTYYVTFRYQDNNQLWGVVDSPTKTSSVVVPYLTNVSNIVIAGQVDVVCQRPLGLPFSSNTTNDDGRGLLDLSSIPNTVQVFSNGTPHVLSAGDRVSVDYQADWQRLLQEGTADVVPERATSVTARQITLGAPFIEDADSTAILTLSHKRVNPNSYQGNKGGWGDNNFASDTGGPLTGNTASGPTLLSPIFVDANGRNNTSDLKASRVTFDTTNTQGFTSRISYRTRDGWSQQLSVAAASYKPFVPTAVTDPPQPWRDYYLDKSSGIIYFHASEAGKSVMVTYSYNSITLRNRLLAIEDDPLTIKTLPNAFSANGFASRLQLTDADGNELGTGQLSSISSVRGASVTVRTAWLDGSRYTQSFLTAVRPGTGAEAMP